MKYFPLFLLLTACNVQADTYLTTTIASYHSDRDTEYNEFNFGLGINHDQWIAGFYDNSHDTIAWYAGYEFRYPMIDNVQLGLQVEGLYGYETSQLSAPNHNDIHLIALPCMIIGQDIQHKVGIVPVDDWTITYQIDWRF